MRQFPRTHQADEQGALIIVFCNEHQGHFEIPAGEASQRMQEISRHPQLHNYKGPNVPFGVGQREAIPEVSREIVKAFTSFSKRFSAEVAG